MKTLLISAVLLMGLSGAGFAQSTPSDVGVTKMSEGSLLVRELLGAPIYNFRGTPNTDAPMPLSGANRFEKIATIRDVMINADGEVEAVIMSVGGFWGLADREVTVAMEGITVVTDVRGDKYFVIYIYDDTLGNAPRFNKFDIE
jgi:hypothetical protein